MGELLLAALIIFVAYVVISRIYRAVRGAVLRRRQKKLDEIARDVLRGFDFNKEKEEIKSIGSRYASSQYTCPSCNGMLAMRNGRYGKFWGCNRYPECKYTRNV